MRKDVKLPEIADNVESGYLARILVSVGDVIEEDQSVIEVETDKATTDIPSPYGGKVVDIKVNAGDEIRVGQTILVVESSEEEDKTEEKTEDERRKTQDKTEDGRRKMEERMEDGRRKTEEKAVVQEASVSSGHSVPASPSVRRFARELGLNINKVKGKS